MIPSEAAAVNLDLMGGITAIVFGAMEIREGAKFWREYKKIHEHISELEIRGDKKLADSLKKRALRLKRKSMKRLTIGGNIVLSHSAIVSSTILKSVLEVNGALHPAIAATSVAGGVLLSVDGIIGGVVDSLKLSKKDQFKRMFKEDARKSKRN